MQPRHTMRPSVQLSLMALSCWLPTAFCQFNWAAFTNAAAPQSGDVRFPNTLVAPFVSYDVCLLGLHRLFLIVLQSCFPCIRPAGVALSSLAKAT